MYDDASKKLKKAKNYIYNEKNKTDVKSKNRRVEEMSLTQIPDDFCIHVFYDSGYCAKR